MPCARPSMPRPCQGRSVPANPATPGLPDRPHGRFWRNVASALSGTAVAQLIPIVGTVALARLYAPSAFGLYAAWLGVVLLLAVLLTGRFEAALAGEPDGEPRRSAARSTLCTVLLAAGLAAVAGAVVLAVLPGRLPAVLALAAVPAALAVAAAQTWQSWAAAEGRYHTLSAMRIGQAAVVTLAQVAAGLVFASPESLALAYGGGTLAGLLLCARLMPLGPAPASGWWPALRAFWRRNRRYPQFSLPAAAINSAAAQLPLLVVAQRFGADAAGMLALVMRTLGAPIGILGRSVLDVFKRRAAASLRDRGECWRDYRETFLVLLAGSVVFCVPVAFFSEALFALAFGPAWRGAGTMALWLLPLFALRFIASPLGYTLYLAGRQHVDLAWQITLLGMTVAALWLPATLETALQAYGSGYCALYLVYLALSFQASRGLAR